MELLCRLCHRVLECVMRPLGRQELIVVLLGLLCACTYGMKVDFSKLRQIRKPYLVDKRGDECKGSPCPADKPFLCKTTPTCIALEYICDHNEDCPGDGFDENPAVCNARNRPPVEQLYEFLERNREWIIPKMFDGADPEFVAHTLAISTGVDELERIVGIGSEGRQNIHDAFMAVIDGDERPLIKLGMPEEEWYDVQYTLNKLLEGGFEF